MFTTLIDRHDGVLSGPVRHPRQMLSKQEYGGHASIHNDATAKSMGFLGGTIEGPTHFSPLVPLCVAVWGDAWLERGCLSARYRSPAYDGDAVRAFMRPAADLADNAEIWIERTDGTEILRGTASLGPSFPQTALETRLSEVSPPKQPVLMSAVQVGAKVPPVPVRLSMHDKIGALYPFTLADKLEVITEPSPVYQGADNRWGRPIVPFEMISVLMQYSWDDTAIGMKRAAIGMFVDQEIKLFEGPVFVDEDYEISREVLALGDSRRTESVWIRSKLTQPGGGPAVAEMLLNSAFIKESYPDYEAERHRLHGD